MNSFENNQQTAENNENKKEKKEGLSTGWKAMGSISLGLLLGGKIHKLMGPLGGGLEEEEIKKMNEKGGWFKSVVKKTIDVYQGFEKLEDIGENFDFKRERERIEGEIEEASNPQERETLEKELEELIKEYKNKVKQKKEDRKVNSDIGKVLKDIFDF